MKELKPLHYMLVSSGIGLIFTVLAAWLFRQSPLKSALACLMGSFSAVCGYLMIWFQFQPKAGAWVFSTVLGFFIRMVFYGICIFICLYLDWNPLFYLAGFLICRYSLYFFNHRR